MKKLDKRHNEIFRNEAVSLAKKAVLQMKPSKV